MGTRKLGARFTFLFTQWSNTSATHPKWYHSSAAHVRGTDNIPRFTFSSLISQKGLHPVWRRFPRSSRQLRTWWDSFDTFLLGWSRFSEEQVTANLTQVNRTFSDEIREIYVAGFWNSFHFPFNHILSHSLPVKDSQVRNHLLFDVNNAKKKPKFSPRTNPMKRTLK